MFLNLIPQTPKPTLCIFQKQTNKQKKALSLDTTLQDKKMTNTVKCLNIVQRGKIFKKQISLQPVTERICTTHSSKVEKYTMPWI